MGTQYNFSHSSTLTELGDDDTKSIFIDSSITREMFNWKPSFDLEDGVKYTIEWYKINGVSKTFTHLKNIIN
jgi:nucleoside-diphosphate-sugar epimerase